MTKETLKLWHDIREAEQELRQKDIEVEKVGLHPATMSEIRNVVPTGRVDFVWPTTSVPEGDFVLYHEAPIGVESIRVPTPEQVKDYVRENVEIDEGKNVEMALKEVVGSVRLGIRTREIEFDFVENAEQKIEEENLAYFGPEIENRVEKTDIEDDDWEFEFKMVGNKVSLTEEAMMTQEHDLEEMAQEEISQNIRQKIDEAVAEKTWVTPILAYPKDEDGEPNFNSRGVKVGEKREKFDYVFLTNPEADKVEAEPRR